MKMKKLLVIILALALIVLPLVSCNSDTAKDPVDQTTEAATEPEDTLVAYVDDPLLNEIANKIAKSDSYLIFSIGDSITEGKNASDRKNLDYTAQFAKKLGEQFSEKAIYRVDGIKNENTETVDYPNSARLIQKGTDSSKITVVRSGYGGNTAKRLIDRSSDFINKEINGETGNLFIICVGINDSLQNTPEKYVIPPKYKQYLNDLIDMIYESHPDADIILMTPTYVGYDGSWLTMHVNAMKTLAKEREIALIDLNKLWMDHWVEGAGEYGQGDWLDTDSCHPTDKGHEAIADEMIRCLFGSK